MARASWKLLCANHQQRACLIELSVLRLTGPELRVGRSGDGPSVQGWRIDRESNDKGQQNEVVAPSWVKSEVCAGAR